MLRFSFPAILLDRLSRLHLAADSDAVDSALNHIHLQVAADRIRFSATSGKMLAALAATLVEPSPGCTDALLDVIQFTTAIKALMKGGAGNQPVQVLIEPHEVRFTRGQTSALVRRIPKAFPQFEHIFTKPVGMRWVPCLASLNPNMAAAAQRIAGKTMLLFSTPVPMGSLVTHLWQAAKPDDTGASLRLTEIRQALGPAFWSDGELAILLMPMSRGETETQWDLSGFAMSTAPTASAPSSESRQQPATAAA
jgi:hypothetical protein